MSDKADADANYYNDDYYQMTADDDYLSEEERIVHKTPTFKTESTDLTVNEGETIKLPCFLDTLGEQFTLMLQTYGFQEAANGVLYCWFCHHHINKNVSLPQERHKMFYKPIKHGACHIKN